MTGLPAFANAAPAARNAHGVLRREQRGAGIAGGPKGPHYKRVKSGLQHVRQRSSAGLQACHAGGPKGPHYKRVRTALTLFVAFALLIALSRVASATDDPPPTVLATHSITPAEPAEPPTDESQQPQASAPKNEPRKKGDKLKLRWRSASLEYGKKLRIDFRTRLRAETRASDAAITKEELDALDIPRRRVGFDGEILKAVAFKVDYELDATNSAGVATDRPWRDVYFDITQLEELQFRYGQFKMPFSLDENTGSQDLDFAYRSAAATLLAPSRARGWMVHGDTLGRTFGYEYGVFRTDGSNAIVHTSEKRVNAGETTAWRITIEPLHGLSSPLADVHFAYARTGADLPEGISGTKGRTVLGADFYKPEFYVFGRRERRGFEFQWRPGPASLKMESITLTEERKGESVENTDLSPYEVRAWYVSGSYAFTGESKSRGLDRPRRPLFQGGIGAVEAAVRVEKIHFGSVQTGIGSRSVRADVLPSNTDNILSFSGNWYPNRWIKVQFTVSTEEFSDPSTVTQTLRPTPRFWSRVLRVQFSI
jgi:phosphate-selective porin OprO/OprP